MWHVALVLLPALAAAAPASLDSNISRCQVGVSFSGLGPVLDGDYIGDGDRFFRFDDKSLFEIGFTWKNSQRPQQSGWGCYFWGCSSQDQSEAEGKWGIVVRVDPLTDSKRLLAVCEKGCPDFKPSCGDIYNQPPDDPDLIYCPIWPEAWHEPMTWRIVNDTHGALPQPREVSSEGYCCKRKPMLCDACGDSSCTGLIGMFHNSCPPHSGSPIHPVSPFQQACCVTERQPPTDASVCVCGPVDTQCDHSVEDAMFAV